MRIVSACGRRAGLVPALLLIVLALAGAASAATVSTFAVGLNNPRGLEFGPDGNLYVPEGGLAGPLMTTPAQCEQVPPPVGPYSGGFTADVLRFAPDGTRTIVTSGLPSDQTSAATGMLRSGVADVAFIGDTLYALISGAGCSHGLFGTDNEILRVNADGSTTQVANLSAFIKTHPVAHPNPPDFEPDGTWYSMVAVRGDLYAVEPNHGEVDRVDPTTGAVSRVVDVSASYGHNVPTALAYKGNFFLGNLGTFPVVPGTETVFKLTPSGQLKPWATGLTTILGLALDGRDPHVRARDGDGPRRAASRLGGHRTDRSLGRPNDDRVGTDLPDGDDDGPGRGALGPEPGLRPGDPGFGQILRIDLGG